MTPSLPSDFGISTGVLDGIARRLHFMGSSPSKTYTVPSSIIITGATGFLGLHLLVELVKKHPDIDIFCIARNPGKAEEMALLFELPPDSIRKARWIEGDLKTIPTNTLPHSDIVIHGAARMHALISLRHLWDDNIDTTLRLLDYCSAHESKMHFVSSLSVFVSSNSTGEHANEPLPVDEKTILYGGYAQSKYIGESGVLSAGGQISRLGLLTGSRRTGTFPENVFFVQFIRTLRHLGIHPETFDDAWVDLTPVDHAAETLAEAITQPDHIIHIANRKSLALSHIVEVLKTRPVSRDEFESSLSSLPRIDRVLLYYAFFKKDALKKYPKYFNIDLFQSTSHSYGIEKDLDVSNEDLLDLYLKTILRTKS